MKLSHSNHFITLYQTLVEKYATPLYVYDLDIIKTQYSILRKILPASADIHYSMKANPSVAILQFLKLLGSKIECCSIGELEICLATGFDPKDIIYLGPAKNNAVLERCVTEDIKLIVCESLNELERLNDIAKRHNKKVNILLRINPSFSTDNARLQMTGIASQFGIDEIQLEGNKEWLLALNNIVISGIHVYSGTGILDETIIVKTTRKILELATKLSQEWNVVFDYIDIGGGFGVPYYESENNISLNNLQDGLAMAFNTFKSDYPYTKIIVESGRFLVADCGKLCLTVIDVKPSKGKNYVITDGGLNCFIPPKNNFPVTVISNTQSNTNELYQITGPLCTPTDCLATDVALPKVHIGDIIIFDKLGAYGRSAALTQFLSHDSPAEVVTFQNAHQLAKQRTAIHDTLHEQNSLEATILELLTPLN